MLPISVRPSAHSAASITAMPARMSGDSTRAARSRRGPWTSARCGSAMKMLAPIEISLSQKNRRDSNIHSWTRTSPSLWVASATAIEVRSAGKAGHGPSWTLEVCSPMSRSTTSRWPPGTMTSAPSSWVSNPMRRKTRRIIRRSSGSVSLIRISPPVMPAMAMNDPISMWSGPMSCVVPPSVSAPVTCRTLEPMPRMSAPILTSMRARSTTCGSEAALKIWVSPGVRAAASSAFSVPMTDGSSMKTSPADSLPASDRIVWSWRSMRAPSAWKASRCGSSRRRPMTSPPGGGMSARPKRASSGPASRKDARIRAEIRGSTDDSAVMPAAQMATAWSPRHSTVAPRSSSRSSMAWTSRMRGMLRTTTSSAVRADAARQGRAAFLLPAGTTVPDNGEPPSMTNFSMRSKRPCPPPKAVAERWARVTAMSSQLSRAEAWDLLTEWVASPSLRRHCLAVEAAMVGYARRNGEDEERWAVAGLLHDADYERHPDMDDIENGHPRTILKYLKERDADPEIVDAIAGHAPFLDVPRETPMAKTLFAVDELSGFISACAYVRATGIDGMAPKSVKKKLKQPSFAAGVNRDEVREGAEALGVDFDEHLRFVIAALEERADELELHGQAAEGSASAAPERDPA